MSLEWEAIEAISFDDDVPLEAPEVPLEALDVDNVPEAGGPRDAHEAWANLDPVNLDPAQHAAGRQAHLAKLREEVEALKMKEVPWKNGDPDGFL